MFLLLLLFAYFRLLKKKKSKRSKSKKPKSALKLCRTWIEQDKRVGFTGRDKN